jgi:hypothetical protein
VGRGLLARPGSVDMGSPTGRVDGEAEKNGGTTTFGRWWGPFLFIIVGPAHSYSSFNLFHICFSIFKFLEICLKFQNS